MGTKALLCLFALFTGCSTAEASQTPTTQGRFQLVQLGAMRADQFMLDTQTGRIWQRVCPITVSPGEDCATEWHPMPVK